MQTMSNISTTAPSTVCLALGPYRNLTTLTAATLFLHPNCQVLNHARGRIYGNPEVDFISDYSAERFSRFIAFAIEISGGGERGPHGGSITLSHAFDEGYDMKHMFSETGQGLIKKQIDCLFWKESLATSNRIRDYQVDLAKLVRKEPRLRFLMPIRNPMDCALSNLKTGHVRRFPGMIESPGPRDALSAILKEFHWFEHWRSRLPQHFFLFYEHDMNRQMLENLAEFLRLSPDPDWLQRAQSVMVSKSGYTHSDDFVDFYIQQIGAIFKDNPVMRDQLLKFARNYSA